MENILVFVADALRYGTFQEYFGWLIEESFVYTDTWATAGATVPSWFSIWTGLYPSAAGIRKTGDWSASPGLDDLAYDLGYENTMFVTENGYARGAGIYKPVVKEGFRGAGFDFIYDRFDPEREPWFLYYHNMGCHAPYLGLPSSPSWLNGQKSWSPDPARHDKLRAAYDAGAANVSSELRNLLEWLPDCTLVLVADHGESFYEHGTYGHISDRLFPELLHVPMLVRDGKRKSSCHNPLSIKQVPDIIVSAAEGKRTKPTMEEVRAESYVYDHPCWLVRRDSWVAFYGPGFGECFYDLRDNPMMLDDDILSKDDLPEDVAEDLVARMERPMPVRAGRNLDDEDTIEEHLRALGYVE